MKNLKIAQVVGVLLLLFGVIVRAGTGELYGMYFVLFGILIYATARVIAWVKSDKD
jgi:cell shape-determining protein MreD